MKSLYRIALYLLFLVTVPGIILADDFLYKQLSISNGFPPSIESIYAEENGFVWIGSKQGLGKFDGYTLQTYIHDSHNPYSLPGNEIYSIEEDSLQNLWILTNKGVSIYQRETDRFIRISNEQNQPLVATALCKMPGKVLLIDRKNIYQFDYTSQKIKTVQSIQNQHSTVIRKMIPWNGHMLLCLAQWGGVTLLNLRNGNFQPTPLQNDEQITRIFIDHKERIWGSTYNNGLTCWDKQGNILSTYTTTNSQLSHNVILSINEYRGKIWVGTDGGGINIIDPEKKEITILRHLSGDKNSLPINSIQCLFQRDNQEDIWAGSIKGGLIHLKQSFIRSYTDVPLGAHNGLSERAILSFFQEPTSTNEIWIGTDGGGINKFNPQKQQFVHYPNTYGEKIVSICSYSAQELLISIFAKGVFFFHKQTGQIRPINEKGSIINQLALYGRKGINLYQDEMESVLILAADIHRYNLKSGRVQQLNDSNIHIEGQATPIGYDSLKTYLYDLKHIYAIDRRDNTIATVYSTSGQTEIECVSKDTQGQFWIASTEGISLYSPQEQTETSIIQLHHIHALVCDNQQRVWIGTNEALYVWLTDKKVLISLDSSDGADDNEYLRKAIWATPQGDIYMGGINGMLHIRGKDRIIEIPSPPSLTLADVISNNKSYLSEINQEQKLNLSYDNKTITIKVMAHESNIFRKRIYRWYINGKEERFADSTLPEITLRSLTPGDYRIAVSCSTKDGAWISPQSVITFSIPPVWYKTGWFHLLWIFVLSSLLIAVIMYLLQRKEERMKADLQKHKQKIYEEKVRFLININHELRTPLTLIHTPISQLLDKLPKDHEIYPILKSIQKQSRRMKDLLNMVLHLRKMEMETSTLNLQTYHLNQWIKDVIADFKYEEEAKHVHIHYDFSPDIDEVCFDAGRHIIILTNLIINAFKHSPENGVITIRTDFISKHQSVRISVIDQGPGLQGVDTEKLFTRFYQGENEKEGTGIGLSYAKILVELHRGEMKVCNNPDRGACFYYELPLQQTASSTRPPQEYLNILDTSKTNEQYTPLDNPVDTRNYSCLFVDDNKDIRQLIIDNLKGHFKNLYIASNGKEAFDIILREIPDIVVSDIMMPEMNGYELCRQIKENKNINYIQLILLTARTDEQSHINGYKTGADGYLEKPFTISALMESIRARLYLREQIRERYNLHSPLPENGLPVSSADDTFLFKLNKLIMGNMENEDLNVIYICKEIGISRASLYNKLKTLTNLSPNEYINKLRMERAIELLQHTQLSMTEIAERTGFSSNRYFSTAFKKYTGITPTQYKEKTSHTKEA